MDQRRYPKDQVAQVRTFLTFLLDRAKGRVKTGARFIRDFVLNHPEYKKDSVVSNKISYDLMSTIINMNHSAEQRAALLLGDKVESAVL